MIVHHGAENHQSNFKYFEMNEQATSEWMHACQAGIEGDFCDIMVIPFGSLL